MTIDTSREAVEKLVEWFLDDTYEQLDADASDMIRDLLARAEAAEIERDVAKDEAERLRDALIRYDRAAMSEGWGADYGGPHCEELRQTLFQGRAAIQETTND